MATITIKKNKLIKFKAREILSVPNGDYRGYLEEKALQDYFIKTDESMIMISEVRNGKDEKNIIVPITDSNLNMFDLNYNIRPSDKKIRISIE